MITQIIIDNITWIIGAIVAGVAAYVTIKFKLATQASRIDLVCNEVKELRSKQEKTNNVIHELRRKQDSLETELKYSKEGIERQLTAIEGYMVRIEKGLNNG